jgi:hypothetical protein
MFPASNCGSEAKSLNLCRLPKFGAQKWFKKCPLVVQVAGSGFKPVLHNFNGSDGYFPQTLMLTGNTLGETTFAGGSYGYNPMGIDYSANQE